MSWSFAGFAAVANGSVVDAQLVVLPVKVHLLLAALSVATAILWL